MTTTNNKKSLTKAGKADAVKTTKTSKSSNPSRLDQLQQLVTSEGGASIAEMVSATGWQIHSVRGALAGALKKRGLTITSEKIDGVRRYRGVLPA